MDYASVILGNFNSIGICRINFRSYQMTLSSTKFVNGVKIYKLISKVSCDIYDGRYSSSVQRS